MTSQLVIDTKPKVSDEARHTSSDICALLCEINVHRKGGDMFID